MWQVNIVGVFVRLKCIRIECVQVYRVPNKKFLYAFSSLLSLNFTKLTLY